MGRYKTPKISNKKLLEMFDRLKPIVTHDGQLYHIRVPEGDERIAYLRSRVYYVNPDLAEPARDLIEVTGGMMPHPIDPKWYLAHEPGEYTITIAEVLANFAHAPAEFMDRICAFEFHGFATGTVEDLLYVHEIEAVRAMILLFGRKK